MPTRQLFPSSRTLETAREQLALYERTHNNDVIASSPIIQGPGEQPHRIVLRDLGGEFVVHLQVIPVTPSPFRIQSPHYLYGQYVRYGGIVRYAETREEVLPRAWALFEAKCRNYLGINVDADIHERSEVA